ncbi:MULTISPECIES: toxin-antitoxin system YwqK family antitoxin [Nocardiopsis]|uniref:Uncharacterized protein n=1 Tax=Nocardiopsis sinuspersici TaxID=501010 RepID=A0A1V3BXT4_9ACTN|nr:MULTISPECIES: hypothetical protein [Nocardiopsis]OOC53265.1 hypothetical protein NOSIN_05065 [Nocardiopsis sinuspersici]
MRRVDDEELDHLEETTAVLHGEGFTGQVVEADETEVTARTFVNGVASGPDLSWNGRGQLVSLGNLATGGLPVGPSHHWDAQGRLVFEYVNDVSGNHRLSRRWDASGRLVSEERHEAQFGGFDPATGERVFLPWQRIRLAPDMRPPEHGGFLPAVGLDALTVSDVEGLGRRVLLKGTPYTGEAVTRDRRGRAQMHTFVEGVEDGPTLTWAPSGKLVIQGITQHPHGPVGPWHQWDEQGRLLREIVHDALGNRVIVRELDRSGNITREERRPPTRLARDPETGAEHPAPWL